jgi:hypothetical protein
MVRLGNLGVGVQDGLTMEVDGIGIDRVLLHNNSASLC